VASLNIYANCADIEQFNCSLADSRLSDPDKWYRFDSGLKGVHDKSGRIHPNVGIQLIRGSSQPLVYVKTWEGAVAVSVVEPGVLRLALTVFNSPPFTVITPILGDLVIPFLPQLFSVEWSDETLSNLVRLGVAIPEIIEEDEFVGYYGDNGSIVLNASCFSYTLGDASIKIADLFGLDEEYVTGVRFVCWENRVSDSGLCIPIDQEEKTESSGLKIWHIAVMAGVGVVVIVMIIIVVIVVKKKHGRSLVRETNEGVEMEEGLSQPTMDEMGLYEDGNDVITGGKLEVSDSD
jgi:hypothetical protein